jgi:uncharacterized protein GlcG (DUF336 family)
MSKLTLAEAEAILAGTLDRGELQGTALSVAIVDAGGHLIAAKRADGARALTPSIAIAKAYSAAIMERPTNMLQEWAQDNPGFFAQLSQMAGHPIVAAEGGVTVKRDGEVLGGLGVSGGTPEQDQQACEEALKELGYELVFS